MNHLQSGIQFPKNLSRLLLILAFMALPTWAALSGDLNDSSSAPIKLQLKWHHQFQFAGYYAAQAKGFYAREGLNVKIIPGDANHPPIKEVLEGDADFGVSDADVLTAYLQGKPLVVLAAIFQHSPYILMTRADRGIRTPSDLRGRTIMLSDEQGIAQLKAVFRREGMSLDAVHVVPHSWDNQVLIDGRVDAISAYSTVEPFQLQARGVKPGMIRAMDYGVDFYGDTLFTTSFQIARHPDRVEAFRRASLLGWEYAMANPDEIIELILAMPGVRERGLTREMLRFEANAMRELILPGLVDMGHMNPGRWETIARIYANIGMIPKAPKPGALDPFIYDPTRPNETRWILPLLSSLTILAVVSLVVVLWNVHLRQAVARRTAALLEAEQKLRYHVENSPLAVVEWDKDYRVIRWTGAAEHVFGWRRHEVMGKHPNEWHFVHEDDQAAVTEIMKQLVDGRELRNVSHNRNYRKDGSVAHCEWYNSGLVDAQGRIVSILSLALDVTTRTQAEVSLRQSQENLAEANAGLEQKVRERTAKLRELVAELEHMSYSIIHDMRAPLRALQGFGAILMEDEADRLSPAGKNFLQRLIRAAGRMDQLITDSIAYNRAVREELPLEPVNTAELLHGIVESYPNFQPPRAEIRMEGTFPVVLGNAAGITQCFSNLLGNAVKFSRPGQLPRVTIRAAAGNGTVKFFFEDNGIGIPKNAQSRIFDMFQRLHPNDQYEGTGIGLALVRKVVERMGGKVGVESEPDVGSCFWIELRQAPQDEVSPYAPSSASDHPHNVNVV